MEEIKDLIKQIRNAKKRRKLRSAWTFDMSYDISQYSGIDSSIEEELVKTLLKEMGNDIL